MDAPSWVLPRSLTAWLPFLWSRVLFPARPLAPQSIRPRAFLLLVLLQAALLYPCLSFRLFEPDESRYAQIPFEMARSGELVVPTLQGEPYLDKPPLLYWLVMGSYRVFGVHDWSARLVPALAVQTTVLLVYVLGCRLVGERSAWWGALLLGVAPGFVGMGRLLILDGLLTLWTTLALLAGFEALRGPRLRWGWWAVSALACGLGVLTKGPVALLLQAVPLALYHRLSGQGCRPGLRGTAFFVALACAVALPWYVALCRRMPEFAAYFFWEHNVQRFLTPYAHARGVWFYVPVVWASLLPGSLLLVPWVRFLLGAEMAQERPPELGFLLLAGGWCVFFFSLSACKLPTYILPALPFLALALGHFLTRSSWSGSPWPARLIGLSAAGLAFSHYLALPWYAEYRSPMSRPQEVLALCADPEATVVCYPRNCDSVAFYSGRADLRSYRSKDIEELRWLVRKRPRVVVLCTHRHSLRGLKELLPPEVDVVREQRLGLSDIRGVPPWLMRPLAKLMGETALGLCDLAVIEPVGGAAGVRVGSQDGPGAQQGRGRKEEPAPVLSVPGAPRTRHYRERGMKER